VKPSPSSSISSLDVQPTNANEDTPNKTVERRITDPPNVKSAAG
jgi:hypothetical protein